MKNVICLLQNAWGSPFKDAIFVPNERNYSCRVLRKIVGDGVRIHFCNTTPVVTANASMGAGIDEAHMEKLVVRMRKYDLILVCGKQAGMAFAKYEYGIGVPLVSMPHPASRNFPNGQRDKVTALIKTILGDS